MLLQLNYKERPVHTVTHTEWEEEKKSCTVIKHTPFRLRYIKTHTGIELVSTRSPVEREIELKIKMNERRREQRRSGCHMAADTCGTVWLHCDHPSMCGAPGKDVTMALTGNDYTCPYLKRWVTAVCRGAWGLQRWRLQSAGVFQHSCSEMFYNQRKPTRRLKFQSPDVPEQSADSG